MHTSHTTPLGIHTSMVHICYNRLANTRGRPSRVSDDAAAPRSQIGRLSEQLPVCCADGAQPAGQGGEVAAVVCHNIPGLAAGRGRQADAVRPARGDAPPRYISLLGKPCFDSTSASLGIYRYDTDVSMICTAPARHICPCCAHTHMCRPSTQARRAWAARPGQAASRRGRTTPTHRTLALQTGQRWVRLPCLRVCTPGHPGVSSQRPATPLSRPLHLVPVHVRVGQYMHMITV